jgi:integrase/recombinase XerD
MQARFSPRSLKTTALFVGGRRALRAQGSSDRRLPRELGLRPRVIANLRLENIDWRAGTLYLRERKTRRGAVLPLPGEAGRTIVDTCVKSGPRPMIATCSCSTATLVAAASEQRRLGDGRRGQVEPPLAGGYVLRHTLATRDGHQGGEPEGGRDLLGHRSLDTIAIYAKLDLAALREVALPWPEEVSR